MAKGKCTEQVIEEAVNLKRNGMTNKDIAAYIGIAEQTFYKWLNQPKGKLQREFSESLKKTEPEFKAALRSKILKAAEGGTWQAAAWLLERLYPEEYGRKERAAAEPEAKDTPVIVNDITCE